MRLFVMPLARLREQFGLVCSGPGLVQELANAGDSAGGDDDEYGNDDHQLYQGEASVSRAALVEQHSHCSVPPGIPALILGDGGETEP